MVVLSFALPSRYGKQQKRHLISAGEIPSPFADLKEMPSVSVRPDGDRREHSPAAVLLTASFLKFVDVLAAVSVTRQRFNNPMSGCPLGDR
jgi:hypothetical protein